MAKSFKYSDIIKNYEDQNVSGEFFVWIEKLELVAELQGGSTDILKLLPLFLAGPAFAVYQQLSAEVKADYEKLKSELSTAFSIDAFSSYEQLKGRTLMEGESVDVYLADLRRLVCLMGQKNADSLLKCAFVSGLPADVAMSLKSSVNVSRLELPEIVSKARAMLAIKNAGSSVICAGIRQDVRTTGPKCFACSGLGHISRDCANNKRDRQPGARNQYIRKCFVCQSPEHLAHQCPERSGKVNGGASASDTHPASRH